MHNRFYKTLPAILFTLLTYNAFSQTSDTIKTDTTASAKVKKRSSFKIGADYISNNVFMGRIGINNIPIISPDIKYTFKPGLYFSGSMDILPNNKSNTIDGGNLTVGYNFDLTDDLDGGVSYTKMLYNSNSTLIGSSISSTFNANFDYEISDIITPGISADYSINTQDANDVSFNPGIAHDFVAERIFGSKDVIIISPTISANFGTQNFYAAYIKRKVFKKKKINALVTAFEAKLGQFKLLDYEFSIPLEYKIGHLVFQVTPTYAIVQNGFKSLAVAKAVGLSDNTSVFYVETGLALKF